MREAGPVAAPRRRYSDAAVKRSTALQPLSRDHHQALYAALRLRRATAADAGDAIDAFASFWRRHGQRHFQIEEEVLLPGFVGAGGDPLDPRVARMLTDHVAIRARARQLDRSAPLGALSELGRRLAAHVRLEEDELFPLIEETLSPDALGSLGEELVRAERRRSEQ
jgi:hemerythrin-like domain-containing protein